MKKIACALLGLFLVSNIWAQSATENKNGPLWDHMVGVQVNGLIKAVVNSSASTSANPYLVVYSMHNKQSGWGWRAGAGYNSVSNTSTTAYGSNSVKNTDFNFRVGVEKFFELSKKWTAAAGIDALVGHNDDFSSSNQYDPYGAPDSSANSVKTLQTMIGGGPFGELYYHVTDRVLIGTEASFYYKTGTKEQTAIDQRTGYPASISKINPSVSGSSIYLPIVFYLSLRF